VEECYDGEAALAQVKNETYSTVLLDNRMPPGPSGLEIFARMREADFKLPVIIMTAFGTTETAIEAMKLGAYDYVTKPFDLTEILALTEKSIKAGKLMREVVSYPNSDDGFDTQSERKIIGSSRKMQEVYKIIGQVAESDATVLIRGDSGVGKELVVKLSITTVSERANPFSQSTARRFQKRCLRANYLATKGVLLQGRRNNASENLSKPMVEPSFSMKSAICPLKARRRY
jgi:two-component system nitrogen regulation response regulator GlnG